MLSQWAKEQALADMMAMIEEDGKISCEDIQAVIETAILAGRYAGAIS